jgi:N-acetylmuramoyl-L-alanine amidase
MAIFKQSRCIALLVGVILVSFSAISLLNPEGSSAGENVIEMGKLKSVSHKATEALVPDTGSALYRTSVSTSILKPMLYTTAAESVHTWANMISAGWLSPEKLQRQEAANTGTVQPKAKAVVVKASPPAAQTLKEAAKGTTSVNKVKAATQQHPPQHCSSLGPSY